MGMTRFLAGALAMAFLAVAAGCGWAQWPPPGSEPRSASPAPRPAPGGAPETGGDLVFVGADAVIVGKGDTVYDLSRRHRVSMRAIIEANRLAPPYHLAVGQRIVLPRRRQHRVSRGETLYGISRRYGVDTYVLARANDIVSPYTILVDQILDIPGTTVAVAAVPASSPAPSPAPQAPAPQVLAPKPKVPEAVAKPPPVAGKGFMWPVKGKVVSGYGPKDKGLHNDGINIAAARGSPVLAAENGIVAYAGNEIKGFGNLLLIKHDKGWMTAYAHNDELLVGRGERVAKGQTVARVGDTGSVVTPQLHFEIRRGTETVDPSRHLAAAGA